jgi:hypothetical protein
MPINPNDKLIKDFGPGRNSGLRDSLNQTNLDVENPLVDGGPNHFPDYEHFQKYTPNKTYLDTFEEAASVNSLFGTTDNPDILKPNNIFKDGTSLDIENPLPDGGPNRTNAGASNIPNGNYTNVGTNGVVLDKNGNPTSVELHRYLPNKKYINSLSPTYKPSNS